MSWILIMTLTIASRSNNWQVASSIETAQFSSRETCLRAANAWLRQTRELDSENIYMSVRGKALCSPQTTKNASTMDEVRNNAKV